MEMTLYFFITIICAIALAIYGNHIANNHVLNKKSRTSFAISAELVAFSSFLEATTVFWEGRPQYRIIYVIVITIGLSVPHFYCALQCYACGFERLAKIAGIVTAVYSIFIIASVPTGLVFRINDNGQYEVGPVSFINSIFIFFLFIMTIIMLYRLSASAKNRDLRTLFNVTIVMLVGYIGAIVAQSDAIIFVGTSLSFVIIYSYFSGLKQQELQAKIEEKQQLAERLSVETMQALTGALDAKDRYSNGHSYRVSEYSVKLAEHLGWDAERIKLLRYAGLMHDIGKIGIPDSVLNKGGKLTDTEFSLMKAHTTLGAEITANINSVPDGYSAARYHHERFDGRGYPDRKSGTDIPEIARLIAIADSFDAMNSDRIYRLALPREVIREELIRGSGAQFDPDMLKAFVELYDRGILDEIGKTARRDMVTDHSDDVFAANAQDILECFSVGFELLGHWDEYYTRWNQLDHYIKAVCEGEYVSFSLVSVSVVPKEDADVNDEKQQEAIDIMIKSIQTVISRENVCGQISKKEVSVILRTDDSEQIKEAMQAVFLYYYKIYDTEPFVVSYELHGGSGENG